MNSSQQQPIIDSALDAHLTIVNAGAGTGKTHTLEQKAQRHGDLNILYLVYNTSMAAETAQRFPPNVTCMTFHKMAYARFGARYWKKLTDALRVTDVMRVLGLDDDFRLGRDVVDCLMAYCASDLIDFPVRAIAPDRTVAGDEPYLKRVAVLARDLWSKMCNPRSMDVGMVHDGYLKLFHLSRPKLPYGLILLDEGQDINPVMLAIVLAQDCPIYLVGDPNQSIYRFRACVNALAIPADRSFDLSDSFRFGPRVADIANSILAGCKGASRAVVGAGFDTEVGRFQGPRYVLCRTKAGVFRRAVQAVENNQPVAFVGGSRRYPFARMLDAYYLRCSEDDRVRDAFLRGFRTWGQFEQYAEDTSDADARLMVRTVGEYGDRLPRLIDALSRLERAAGSQEAALTLTTAHQSKGMTLPRVELDNDFLDLTDEDGRIEPQSLDEQEVNLLYVSVTRPVMNLEINTQLREFLAAVT